MNDVILNVSNLSFGYNREKIFNNVNFEVDKGDFVALVGPNGAGKSTLIKLILGQLSPNNGRVDLFLNEKLGYRDVGYVPQLGIGSSYTFPITVGELVSLSLHDETRGFKVFKCNYKDKVLDALLQVGMEDEINSLYYQLSGGQRQRVLIAKALVSNPSFLILDEPTNGIDFETRQKLFSLLHHLNVAHGITILMITHELSDIENYISKLYKLFDGRIERCK